MTENNVQSMGGNWIGHKYSAEGDIKFKSFNPLLNKENPWVFSQATEMEVNHAVQKATDSFLEYSMLAGAQRADFLEAIAVEMEQNRKEILEAYVAESALPLGRAEGELARTLGQIRRFANIARVGQWTDPTIDIERDSDIRKVKTPIGPIVVFGASNFPLAFSTAGGDTVSALAVGCPVIVKAHPMHCGTSSLVAQSIRAASQKTDMPEGVFSHLLDHDNSVGAWLVKHPKVFGVGFTGSFGGGKALSDLSQQRENPIPVFAEMGSVNPVLVFPEIVKENGPQWATTLAGSINLGAGQFCTNPGLILGQQSASFKTFIDQLVLALGEQKSGCMLHPRIQNQYESSSKLMGEMGAEVLATGENRDKANFAEPKLMSVTGAMFLQNSKLQQEVFGPLSLVVQCADTEELGKVIQSLDGQLTGTVLGNMDELRTNSNLVSHLRSKVGRLIHNGVPTGVEVCSAMQHGGPYPATTDSRFTSVGDDALERWVRPVAFQNWPDDMLPRPLRNDNPLNLLRKLNGNFTSQRISP